MLCKQNEDGVASIGDDNGMKGGQNYYRRFKLSEYNGKTLLTETKTSSHFAEYFRIIELQCLDLKKPSICQYIADNGENWYRWTH